MSSLSRCLTVAGNVVALLALVVSTGAFALPAESAADGERVRAIVVLEDGVDERATARDMERRHDGDVDLIYDTVLHGFAGSFPQERLDEIERDGRVRYVERDQVAHAYGQIVPTGIQRIFADDNAEIGIDSSDDTRVDVDVAVIDTGIDLDHPDLDVVASTDCSGGSPFTGDCGSGGDDDNGHGTHVAGTVGAIDDGGGVVGVAPGARMWAVKVLRSDGSGYISWIVAGIEWVTERADRIEVANMSLGCECSSDAMDTAITNSVAAGVAYAVAAGNSDADASTFSPANHPDVLTVSALADFDGEPGALVTDTSTSCRDDQDDTLADFSNFGDTIEVAAPGVCILSTVPGGGYDTYSGTSMASPHAAGALGLLASTSDPTSKSDVDALYDTVVGSGNFDWTDDSGDGVQEPLLDVGDPLVFDPALVSGDGASGDASPSVTVTNPADGSTVSGSVSVTADATDDGGVTQVEFFVDGATIGTDEDGSDGWSVSWDTTTSADGSHTVAATATDTAGQTASDSVSVTVDNTNDTSAPTATVAYDTWGGPSADKHLGVDVTLTDDQGNPVGGASVSIRLDNTTTGDAWTATGTTDTDGLMRFELKNAPRGCYTTDVTEIVVDGTTFTDPAESDPGICL